MKKLLLAICASIFFSSSQASANSWEITLTGLMQAQDISFAKRRIYEAITFLSECSYFEQKYPKGYKKLFEDSVALEIIFLPFSFHAFCAYYKAPDKIVIARNAFDEEPECEANLGLIVAHEMLHYAGLPKHKEYNTPEEYFLNDPIERTITACLNKL